MKASALDFSYTIALKFDYCDVVFDLFIETRFLHLTMSTNKNLTIF